MGRNFRLNSSKKRGRTQKEEIRNVGIKNLNHESLFCFRVCVHSYVSKKCHSIDDENERRLEENNIRCEIHKMC
jgi:hypothetical protein